MAEIIDTAHVIIYFIDFLANIFIRLLNLHFFSFVL